MLPGECPGSCTAAAGDATGCERALGHAEEHCTAIDPATTPPSGGHVGEAALSGFRGIAGYTLSLTNRDASTATRAAPLLRRAVDGFGPGYARFRGTALPDLAGDARRASSADSRSTGRKHEGSKRSGRAEASTPCDYILPHYYPGS